jgi:hypothetical protein
LYLREDGSEQTARAEHSVGGKVLVEQSAEVLEDVWVNAPGLL